VLISTHSLHHTQCSIYSASVSSLSVLVFPVHHIQSLPIPSLLLASPPSVHLVRLPLFCSNLFPPVRPRPSYAFVLFHHRSPRHPRPHVLSPLLSHRFRSPPPSGHHYDVIRVHTVLLVPFHPCPYPCPYPSVLPFDFLSLRLHTPFGCGPSPHEPLNPRTRLTTLRISSAVNHPCPPRSPSPPCSYSFRQPRFPISSLALPSFRLDFRHQVPVLSIPAREPGATAGAEPSLNLRLPSTVNFHAVPRNHPSKAVPQWVPVYRPSARCLPISRFMATCTGSNRRPVISRLNLVTLV